MIDYREELNKIYLNSFVILDEAYRLYIQGKLEEAILYVKTELQCTEEYAKGIMQANIELEKKVREKSPNFIEKDRNIPRCPTCGSTNIRKISGITKAGSVLMFGIFSQKVRHQFRCVNCGYEW